MKTKGKIVTKRKPPQVSVEENSEFNMKTKGKLVTKTKPPQVRVQENSEFNMKTKGKLVTKTKPPQVSMEEDSDSSVYSDLEKDEASESSEEDESEIDESSDHSKEDYFDSSDESCPELVPIESEIDTKKDAAQEDKISVAPKDTPQTVNKINEYEVDSSDEEDIRNTVGNIPMEWYKEFPHLGYDILGNKVMKPATDDEIDEFLNKIDDPNYWRTVRNKMTGEKVVLTDEDCEFIRRIQRGHYPTGEDQYKPWEDFFTYETMKHPVTNAPPHKRSFIPSLVEKLRVGRMVYAIKMGYIKPKKPKEKENEFYMLWDKESTDISKRMQHYIPAPKRKLPGHEESYNPPPEYLFTKEEKEKWQEQDPEDRKLDFVPQKFDCLRRVPAYSQFINESFERCLDLYLCSRQRKMRVNVDPNDLIPQLPKPKDLQPFPTVQSLVYRGHTNMVRCITVEPHGQFLASGSDDNTVKVWEVLTGRCLRTINVGGIVKSISWCPNEALCLLLVAVKENVFIINPKVGDKIIISNTDALLESVTDIQENEAVQWSLPPEEQMKCGIKLVVAHMKEVKQVVWHAKGDYFATLTPAALSKGVVIHQLSQCRSQVPFKTLKGDIQSILFHPLRPFFFMATKTHVKVFNLLKQAMTKKLITNCKWVSSMAIHPHGDNLIIGTYDCRLSWFDLVLSSKPYRTLKHHKRAVRQVAFHKRYPLFASASDDGSLIICHGMVYSDLLQNPLIVPVKVLKGHKAQNDLYVLDCCFHPSRPWVFSSGADNTIILYT